jgi:filamentous hemagglutinin family protein
MPKLYASVPVQALTVILLWFSSLSIADQSHAAGPTPSGLNTQVSPPIVSGTGPTQTTQYNITGGTRPGGTAGTNLFHSFGDFSVPTNNIANFLNLGSIDSAGNVLPGGLPTTNILGRVTSGNPSVIFGMIQTNGPGGFGNANLFLMNPAGFLFGPNATLNVGGMVAFTTADYLRFQNTATLFNNASTPDTLTPLSIAPVAAFGFLGSNPAAIAIQGATLQVSDGQSLSLVGGNQGFTASNPDNGNPIQVPNGITMTGGKLSARGGQINIVSVGGPGEISATDFMPTPGMVMGNISLSEGALVDVSADAAGTVRIRGGQLQTDQATISADTANIDGVPVAIDINVTGDMFLANELAPALTAQTTGTGNAGSINIQSGNLEAITSSLDQIVPLIALIDTHTSGTGTAGSVAIDTGNLIIPNHPDFALGFFLDTGTAGTGHGGDVTIQGRAIFIDGANIATGNARFQDQASGSGGNLNLRATESLEATRSSISTEAWFARAGDITLEAPEIFLQNGTAVALDGDIGSPTITVNAGRLRLDFGSRLLNNTVVDQGGDTIINARVVELTHDSFIQTSTLGDGKAGNITLNATERFTIDDRGADAGQSVSGLISSVLAEAFGTSGGSGSITVTTPQLEMFGGGIINTSTRNSGNSGDVSIFAHSIAITGQRIEEIADNPTELGTTRGSGIYTRTVGSDLCVGPCGNAGNITITTDALSLNEGGTINSGTTNNGNGGGITIHATDSVSISGTTMDGTPSGIYSRTVGQMSDAGTGGNIALTAGQLVTMNNGSTISASSTGPGNTGNIQINAGNQFSMTNSSVTTEATQSGGGAIKITTNPDGTVQLTDSTISASVIDGTGGGGSVDIDPQFVILQNSQILAKAVFGPGGNINITTNLLLPDSTSIISASSQFGQQGNIVIQSPVSPASGKLVPLGQKPLLATSLLSQRCAAIAGGSISSFTVAGRDSLPAEPGGWVSSPLALNISESENVPVREANGMMSDETPLLSVRKIAPPGFLTQAFAVDASGCQS